MAVTIDADEVLTETAALMEYALRVNGFKSGAGGVDPGTFTDETTPKLERAVAVTRRHARIVMSDFASAGEDKVEELVTIAALRSAIELENSTPNVDDTRIENWRDDLREYTGRFSDAGGDGEGGGDVAPLLAVWSFLGRERCHTPGSELPYPDPSRRRRFL
jgi:hypothetical protein